MKGLAVALDDIGDKPLIVRSSSLLEDRIGSAFSGKYKSLFLANRGSKRDRLAAVCDAVAEVYASTFSPDPIEYRAERGLLDLHEEMGIMIQEVVGTQVGRYYLPAFGGVAFSNNEFRWSPRISREDGLVRLVPGLGTRAVDRLERRLPRPVFAGPAGPARQGHARGADAVRAEARGSHQPRRQPVRHGAHRRPAQAVRVEVPDVQAGVLGRRRRRPAPGRRASTGTAPPTTSWPPSRAWPPTARSWRRCGRCCACCARRSAARWTSSSPTTAPTCTCCSAGPQSAQDEASPVGHPEGRAERPRGLRGPAVRLERPRARPHARRVRRSGGVRGPRRRGGPARRRPGRRPAQQAPAEAPVRR